MDIFTQDKPKEDFSKAVKANHHIYDYVFTDSKNERDFVRELDHQHRSGGVCQAAAWVLHSNAGG